MTGVRCWLALSLVSIAPVRGEEWSLDLSVLEQPERQSLVALANVDPAQLQAICRELQQQFQGDYVLDLAPLGVLATQLLPVLEQYPETQPYAAWLRARVDYFAVADALRIHVPSVSLPLEPPSPLLERQLWQEHLKNEPLPVRADFYVPQLKPVFAAVGVPVELVWLAEVESRFIPQARSPVGAVGLYQLMPETADWLGLALEPVDERLDPTQNARAAARYLRYLYRQFRDWPLAIAAYNGGEGRVRRLLAERGARRFDEIAGSLPAETQLYVPKVDATLQRRAGVVLADLPPPTVAGQE